MKYKMHFRHSVLEATASLQSLGPPEMTVCPHVHNQRAFPPSFSGVLSEIMSLPQSSARRVLLRVKVFELKSLTLAFLLSVLKVGYTVLWENLHIMYSFKIEEVTPETFTHLYCARLVYGMICGADDGT